MNACSQQELILFQYCLNLPKYSQQSNHVKTCPPQCQSVRPLFLRFSYQILPKMPEVVFFHESTSSPKIFPFPPCPKSPPCLLYPQNLKSSSDEYKIVIPTEKDKNIQIKQRRSMRPYKRQENVAVEPIVIGYYPFRGKVQICRLVCQYLHVPYVDAHFTPDQWTKFKDNQAKTWIIKDLPFLKDGDFVVTGPAAMVHYIVGKMDRVDLFGRTLHDQIKIDSIRSRLDLRDAILSLICSSRPSLSAQEKKCLHYYWSGKIEPVLRDYENDCPEAGWYFDYITVIDFVIYELLNLIETLFPDELRKFKKLMGLRQRFAAVPEIRNYENSLRAPREYCPVRYFSKFLEERMRMSRREEMEVEGERAIDIK